MNAAPGYSRGGENVAGPGYFYRPTVLTVTDPGEPVICEELFGPVAPVVPFDSEEQVLAWANSSPVGLAAYVHTGDIGRALRMTERLEVGMTGINSAAISNPAARSVGSSTRGWVARAAPRASPNTWKPST